MDGFRITESGDLRITESSDSRITENFIEAFASLSSAGSVTAPANTSSYISASLTSDGSGIFAGEGVYRGATNLSATSSVDAVLYNVTTASAPLYATGSLTASGVRIQYAGSSLSATGSITPIGLGIFPGASSLSSSGSITSTANKILNAAFNPTTGEQIRLTESGDIRVTENDDTRIAFVEDLNSGIGSMSANGLRIKFRSTSYYNDEETWKEFVPYVKDGGEWVAPLAMYRHDGASWKRIR